ncbi:hypothetical protein B0H16DRAFT_1328689 [Mycena metata]|uniref:Uncharacterized protein n=1 Tax=Mycena metata TaxID=1033252 RepID=A0AAD7I2C8_9AGAR|nr:hypothetical protein B0H16DRAFT_1328689 [Mycena metata]
MSTFYSALNSHAVESRVLHLLRSYSLPAHAFLTSLDETRSLVSGSAALWPLHNFDCFPNDLDVYSPEDTAMIMLDILRNRFRFRICRIQATHMHPSSQYPIYLGILRVYWLKRRNHTINFIVVQGDNAAAAIFNFHSTIVMNYFNGTRLYCSMPELTLRKISTPNVNLFDISLESAWRTLACIIKYSLRGITFKYRRRIVPHVCGTDPICPATIRTLHDNAGLVIPFPSRVNVVRAADAYDGSRSVRWSLGGPHCYMPEFSYSTILECIDVPQAEEVSQINF